MNDGFDTSDIDAFARQLARAVNGSPEKAKQFMRQQGTKLKNDTKSLAKSRIHKKTGNYLKSIKRGKVYTYRSEKTYAIRAYSSVRHAHLLEDGHRIVLHGREVGFAPGQHVFADAGSAFAPKFEHACEDFVDTVFAEV